MTMMKSYKISIYGCDDSTMFIMNLSDTEKAVLDRIVAASEEVSTYGCMPTVECVEASTNDLYSTDYELSDEGVVEVKTPLKVY